MFNWWRASAIVCVVVFAVFAGAAQSVSPLPPLMPSTPQLESDRETLHKMEKAREKKRAEEIQRDAQKLLEVATELKAYVDKAGEHTLSLDVIRKAEEMEKLARRIKEKMRGD